MRKLDMRENKTRGFLITVCGLDGCGKTTMLNRIFSDLKSDNELFLTKQPTNYLRESKIFRNYMDSPWLCTGDIALMNDSGLIRIKGRSDDMIIRSGMNIYPAEIEAALKNAPRVKEVFAYGIKTERTMKIGMKICGDFSSVKEVKSMCLKYLPAFQVPDCIEIVEELPKNGSGKIIRSA